MKNILSGLLIIISTVVYGQLIDELPKDENGRLYYSEVIQLDEIKSNELYLRARQFYANTFRSSNDVIQMDDKDNGIIIGKGFSEFYIKIMGVDNGPHQLWYTLKIQCKDGRYKYEVYDFFTKSGLDERKTVESQFDKSVYYKKNGEPKDIYQKMKNAVTENVNGLIEQLKTAMNKKSPDKKDDW